MVSESSHQMALKLKVDKIDDVEANYRPLYTQDTTDQKFYLTGVEGGSYKDVKELKDEAGSWRIQHRDAKAALTAATTAWGALKNEKGEALKPEDVTASLTRLAQLEQGEKDHPKGDQTKRLAELNVELTQLKQKHADVEKERDGFKTKVTGFEQADTNRKILGAARAWAVAQGEAGPDPKSYASDNGALMLLVREVLTVNELGQVVAKEGVDGIEAHSKVEKVMEAFKDQHSYLWPSSKGGGALGSKGGSGTITGNPFKGNDMDARAAARRADPGKADVMMKEAGLTNLAQPWNEKENRPG